MRFQHMIIIHSKKTEPWGVFDFFQMFSKIFQFSLFQCLKDAFVVLTIQFQVYSTLGKQLSFFRAKISGLPFHPQASVRCRCASYIYHSHVRRAKASRRWLCTATALVRCREDDSKNPDMCWYKGGFLNFFLSKQTCFFESALTLSIWRRASGFRRSSLPRFVTVVDREDWCFWNQVDFDRTIFSTRK